MTTPRSEKPPSRERQAIARAIFAARCAGFENEVEGDMYRMAGNFREAYAGVDTFVEALGEFGFEVAARSEHPDLRAARPDEASLTAALWGLDFKDAHRDVATFARKIIANWPALSSNDEPVAEGDGLLRALWDCGVYSGMDTDGDDGPGAMVAGMGRARFAAAMVDAVKELRSAYDECLSESLSVVETEVGREP